MRIKAYKNGLLGSNTYLVWDEESSEAMIVDCGNDPRDITPLVKEAGLDVRYVVLTHGHYDHADYIEDYAFYFPNAKTVCHEAEVSVMNDPDANVSALLGLEREYLEPDMTVDEGDVLMIGKKEFAVISTPGHTPGSICLYCEEERVMFTGDTLFVRGVGRTDFKYGSGAELLRSLRRLSKMDGEITFYSGHGDEGKLKYERY